MNRARGLEGTTTLPWARLQDGRSGDALTDHVVVPVVMVAAVDSCRVSGCFPVTSTSAAWVGGSRDDGGPRGSCHRGKAGRSIICRSGSDRVGDGLCGHRPWGVLGWRGHPGLHPGALELSIAEVTVVDEASGRRAWPVGQSTGHVSGGRCSAVWRQPWRQRDRDGSRDDSSSGGRPCHRWPW